MGTFIVAQIFGIVGIVANLISTQMKSKKHIILMLFILNISSAISLFLLNGSTGSLISILTAILLLIELLFESKNKSLPLFIVIIYALASILLGVITYRSLIDIFPAIAALLYCFITYSPKVSEIRQVTLAKNILWAVYDIVNHSYVFGFSDVIASISTVIAIFRFRKKKRKKARR